MPPLDEPESSFKFSSPARADDWHRDKSLWAFRPVTVARCNGPVLLVVKRVMTSTVRIDSGKPVKLRIQRERKKYFEQ